MDTIIDIFQASTMYWMLALIIIGPFQVIASAIRASKLKDWSSNFGKRLKVYFKLLLAYWLAASITYFLTQFNINMQWAFFLFVPILCTLLAMYYWRAVYLLYKERRRIS